MINNYWQFIIALRYNAQRFFDNEISYYSIQHPWCNEICNVFLVRDFQKNTLLHDSVDHLVIFLAEQKIHKCSLYPLDLLFSRDELDQHHSFKFVNTNYPVAVFQDKFNQSFALIQIAHEKNTLDIQPIRDPRDFWGTDSSQDNNALGLFTLIKLNQEQRNNCFCFNKNLNWANLIEDIQQDLFKNPFSAHISAQFELINNLYLYQYNDNPLPLLNEPQHSPQIGFSLIEMLHTIKANIHNLKQAKNENSPILFFNKEELQQFSDYEEKLSKYTLDLICFTANCLEQENQISDLEKKLIKELQKQYPKLGYSYSTQQEPNSESITTQDEKEINPWIALFSLILIFAVLFGLLYGFYLLFTHFEFIKFAAITIGIMVFLAIWSKR